MTTPFRTAPFRALLSVSSLALILAAGLAGQAQAQTQPTPPEHYTLDPRGVDLVTGRFNYSATDVSIGDPGNGGLSFGRVWTNGGWRDTLSGTIAVAGSIYVVSLGPISEVFVLSSGVYTPVSNTGAKLTQSGGLFTFTLSDGTVATYSTTYSGSTSVYAADNAALMSISLPNGEATTLWWNGVTYCSWRDLEGECLDYSNAVRLEAVSNNRGYMIKFAYGIDGVPFDPMELQSQWLRRVSATGVNLAVDYCTTGAGACTGLTRTWPSATYGGGGFGDWMTTVTDQSGRTTTYDYSSGPLTSIRYPGSVTDDVVIDYASGKVSAVSDATGTWTYGYSDVSTTRTTTVDGPDGQELVVVSDQTIGRATSVTNALSDTWTYAYDGQRRLERVTNPEGDYAELDYDGRGNVIEITHAPKPGSLLSNVTTEITYPVGCTSPYTPANCNLPLSVEDPVGNVTTYEWSATHGGLLSVTAPAVGGVNAQMRYAYASHYAWYKNSLGNIVAAPTPVTLPVEVSACATADDGTGCDGTADEVLTTITYGAPSVANNLLPTVVATGAGDASLTAAVTLTYTPDGDVQTVDGPLPGADDTTQYRYDNGRRLVGVVGPDPDGSGALLNRAQRITYDTRGNVTLVEAGTTPGYSDGNWASFSALQKTATAYDDWGRPIRTEAQSSGGTAYSVAQTSYDTSGRVDCVALRMNPAEFGSLPASACTPDTAAGFGPDRIMKYAYDAADRLISTTSGHASSSPITETVAYTANGLPETLTDGAGNVSILVHDGFDRLSRLRYPNATGGGTSTTDYEEYTYYATSAVATYRNRSGDVFTYGYDARGRLAAFDDPSFDPRVVSYDNLNRPTSLVSMGILVWNLAWTYDALGRRLTEQTGVGTMASQYDLAGRRTRLTWPDSFYVTYEHDLYGGLLNVKESGSTTLAAMAYDNMGRRTAVTRLNGVATAYAYDPVSRLSSMSHDLDGSGDDVAFGYGYNPAGQIISRSASNGAYVYAPTTGSTSYANNGLNQVTATSAGSVTYDGGGNITGAPGTVAFGYDYRNQLVTAGSATYQFDPLNRLYREVGAADRRMQYDGVQLAAEYDSGGTATARYIPGSGLNEVIVGYSGGGLSTRSFPVADERLSVIALSNAAGAATQVNTYDEYGVPAGGNAGRFQYTGQMWLPDAGLYHYRARAYAAGLGRFTGPDPIGYAAGANLYGYVSGDPVNFADPLGLDTRPGVTWTCYPGMDCDKETDLGDIIVTARKNNGIWVFQISIMPRDRLRVGWGVGSSGLRDPTNEPEVCERLRGAYESRMNAVSTSDRYSWNSVENLKGLVAISAATRRNDTWGVPVANALVAGIGAGGAATLRYGRSVPAVQWAQGQIGNRLGRVDPRVTDMSAAVAGGVVGYLGYQFSERRVADRDAALNARLNYLLTEGCR